MCNPLQMTEKEFRAMAKMAEAEVQADSQFGIDWFDPTCCSIEILDAKYDPVSTDEVIDQCSHLNNNQKEDLRTQTWCLSTSQVPHRH